MNKWEKEVQQSLLDSEEAAIKALERQYALALRDIKDKVMLFDADIKMIDTALETATAEERAGLLSMRQSKVYQKQYQEALKSQISAILDKLQSDEYKTIERYLKESYNNAFIGTMYSMAKQGVPMLFPIDQAQAVKAILTDSKLKGDLYTALGVDVKKLKKTITQEISRGIASSLSYHDIARNISNRTNAPLSRAKTIARTESHRIKSEAAFNAAMESKKRGADILKQWDSFLDARTRPSHQRVDGEVRELEEKFSNGMMYPGDSVGGAGEVVNCRCIALTRARWALDEGELETLKERAEYFGLDKSDNFEDFQQKYLKNSNKIVENSDNYGKIVPRAVPGQSRLRQKKTQDIIKRGIATERPIYANDAFGKNIAKVTPEKGYYDVALHGSPVIVRFYGEDISSQALAKIIKGRKDYSGGSIRLLSCNTGDTTSSAECFAQRLADALNVEVKAPTKLIWAYSDGTISIGTTPLSNDGEFVVFRPRKER